MTRWSVTFRVDASTDIGTGHVARCLALAHGINEEGGRCTFVSRAHPNHLGARILAAGHESNLLPEVSDDVRRAGYEAWLGTDWRTDAEQTLAAMAGGRSEWLVVDHYGLDARWEKAVRAACDRLFVIDDLANRSHDCDLLLDQNLGRRIEDYAGRITGACQLLVGPRYALLRPEFMQHRSASLEGRDRRTLRRLLVTMGGVDKDNVTSEVLMALRECSLPDDMTITCVMGSGAPALKHVRALAREMPWPTEVAVDVQMAATMERADLAIGAAGSTSWERCCLGLPCIAVVIAENQREAAAALATAGAAVVVQRPQLPTALARALQELQQADKLVRMSVAASVLVDGGGVQRVVGALRRVS